MSGTDRPACDLVRRALHVVIASETFARSERLRSFLSYIVENELSGKAAQLKGYSIGIDVFGRPPGFDAGNDPLVRVQAGKLRKLLDQYYETEGAAEQLRIRVPLGSYVPEYSITRPEPVNEPAANRVAHQQTPRPKRSWLPKPISSPLALFSLLPLLFLAPSIYPDATSTAIAKVQFILSAHNRLGGMVEVLPQLHILQCWPQSGECNALARAISNSAHYHRTVRLADARESGAPPPLSYSIRVENRADGLGVYARLIHDQSGATIYARHFSRNQLKSEAGIAYEAVAFAARTLSASGPLYRHAIRSGTASSVMQCLSHSSQTTPRGTPHFGEPAACAIRPGAALAEAAIGDEAGATLTR
ncbi:hypothetical protein MUO32_12455 [Shinella sp. CPCC 101442]|uniref:hypothetical protein n=1 Tax=Shinella sp. CPCC 101442 TaxID=2932265 RepID=UPI0021539E43|nr:hypothetical protein [Shinella sp. CPCC 101442]MCR6499851.1 hypothetical protein [Shinella sp. CPCC 101442]